MSKVRRASPSLKSTARASRTFGVAPQELAGDAGVDGDGDDEGEEGEGGRDGGEDGRGDTEACSAKVVRWILTTWSNPVDHCLPAAHEQGKCPSNPQGGGKYSSIAGGEVLQWGENGKVPVYSKDDEKISTTKETDEQCKPVELAEEYALPGEGPDGVNWDIPKDDDEVDDEEVSVDQHCIVHMLLPQVPDQDGKGGNVGDDAEDKYYPEYEACGVIQGSPLLLRPNVEKPKHGADLSWQGGSG